VSLEALGVGQGLDGNSQLSLAVLEIVTFHDADAACIAANEAFIPMKPVCCCVQLMRVGSSASNGVDEARCGINSNGAAHFKEAWLALPTRLRQRIWAANAIPPTPVPDPLPVLGALSALGWSRRLRRRLGR